MRPFSFPPYNIILLRSIYINIPPFPLRMYSCYITKKQSHKQASAFQEASAATGLQDRYITIHAHIYARTHAHIRTRKFYKKQSQTTKKQNSKKYPKKI